MYKYLFINTLKILIKSINSDMANLYIFIVSFC